MKNKIFILTVLFVFLFSTVASAYGDWLWPVPSSFRINSLDYYNSGRLHSKGQSVDIGPNVANDQNTEVVSCTSGKVVKIEDTYPNYGIFDGSWGNYVDVKYDGYNIIYAHLQSISDEAYASLENGTEIQAGTLLGIMGSSGNSTGVHLHLQVYRDNFTYASDDTSFRVFDEFIDNPQYYPNFTFWKGLEKYSKRYGLLIRTNYTSLSGVYYKYTGDNPNQVSSNLSDWAKNEVSGAILNNIVPGDLCLNYKKYISRADFCKLTQQFLETVSGMSISEILKKSGKNVDMSYFADTRNEYVHNICALGIVSGRESRIFDPFSPISRQEAAVILTRTASVLGVKEIYDMPRAFSDYDSIASWAKQSVDFVSATTDPTSGKAVMGGMTEYEFCPDETFTRQQAYISMYRLYNAVK